MKTNQFMDDNYFKTWKLIQFFSLKNEDQLSLIGATENHWFIEEDESNPGANYLIGLCAACLEFCISHHFDHECIHSFRKSVLDVKDHLDPDYWRFERLSKSEGWDLLRERAEICINELRPVLYPLRKPFIIEELVHVDHYVHASEIRKMLRNNK